MEAGAASGTRPARAGRYHLVEPLAQGGMAELLLAESTGVHGFRKYFVVKRILPQWADDREFVEMFLDEARLAAQLDHPNVVHVHDIGEDEGGPFFAMDYIHGQNLVAIMRACRDAGRRVPEAVVVTIGAAAAAGLHHAHTRRGFDGQPLGIIHRDVSPSNIIVSFEGNTKVVDFGIAKATTSRHATRPSTRKGKMAYMSPEQCRGEPLDARSDVFALGIVLYELVTSTRAFRADNDYAVMNQIVNHDLEPPSARVDGVHPELEEILMRALRRDRSDRHPDAHGLQLALEDFAARRGLSATVATLASFMDQTFGPTPYPWQGLASSPADEDPGSDDDATRLRTRIADVATAALEPTTPRPSAARPRPRRWVWPAIGFAAIGVALIGWLLRAPAGPEPRTDDRPSVPTAGAAPAPSPAPSPEAASPVPAAPDDPPPDDPPLDDPPAVLGPDLGVAPSPPAEAQQPEVKSPPKTKKRAPEKSPAPRAVDSPSPPPAFDPDAPAPARHG